jgi:hypothetical protein
VQHFNSRAEGIERFVTAAEQAADLQRQKRAQAFASRCKHMPGHGLGSAGKFRSETFQGSIYAELFLLKSEFQFLHRVPLLRAVTS